MKKLYITVVFFITTLTLQAQEVRYGVTGGYVAAFPGLKTGNFRENIQSGGGTYIGSAADIEFDDFWHGHPGLIYVRVLKDDSLLLPLMVKYYAMDELYAQAGPVIGLFIGAPFEDLSRFKLDFSFGAGYDILDDLAIEARFALQLNNSFSGPKTAEIKIRENHLYFGLVYKF